MKLNEINIEKFLLNRVYYFILENKFTNITDGQKYGSTQ